MIHARTSHAPQSSKAKEYLEGWQRSRAELDNYRKHMTKEQKSRELLARRSAIEPLLDVADNFHAMATHLPADLTDNAWAKGVMHVARQLDQVLRDMGVQTLEPLGQKFDPTQHEAIEQVTDSEAPSGTVVAVVARGYLLDNEILRPAKVKIAQ